MKILVTCPPMLKQIHLFRPLFEKKNIELVAPDVVQTLTEDELIELLPSMDGWIIGDDPATERVFQAGKNGKLKAAVKWGIGVDNVDFEACEKLGIPIINTPNMFGEEVASVAVGYVLGLARQLFYINDGVKNGQWPKPTGMSLRDKTVALIGFGDIGKSTAVFLHAMHMKVNVYDPYAKKTNEEAENFNFLNWPEEVEKADFIVSTCALTRETHHMINAQTIDSAKEGVSIVNVSRGGVIDEAALLIGLKSGKVKSAALDVFEQEPLSINNELRNFESCIFGTHNGSNTLEGVIRASHQAINKLFEFLNIH
ncbi:phosphoglycerate dehydrogenase [Saprospiraceae bacterium]|nr:phosphoglycerate dehydrogenase [Saprospiraceae bacterium]